MNAERLESHIRLCKRNLASSRVKCCATCPFEDEIVQTYPETMTMFVDKREHLGIEED